MLPRIGPRQLQVLRLLYTHRLLTAVQLRALAFEAATPRTCEICLQRLHQKGWVVRAEPMHGGAGGGRRGYVYGISAQGAEALAALAGIPLADIPTVAGPEALEPRYVNHQLAVNSCMLAIRQACRADLGATLREWTADPHARVRYRVGRSSRTVHPDAIAEIDLDGRRRWLYLEVDRGTAELRRYGLKLRALRAVLPVGQLAARVRDVPRGANRDRAPATGGADGGGARGRGAELQRGRP